MIMRFFKKVSKAPPPRKSKKPAEPLKKPKAPPKTPSKTMKPSKKILTAAGWKRLMLKKSKNLKK